MNTITGTLAVGAVVVAVIVMATLLPEVTVGHEPVEPFERRFGVEGEPITYPIPWLVVSLVAIAVGFWRVSWFVRWLEHHGAKPSLPKE